MEQQNEEVLLQQTITKLEHEENSRNPEPDSTRPALSGYMISYSQHLSRFTSVFPFFVKILL